MNDQDSVLREVSRFLHSVQAEEANFDRVLATVRFTDIVDSTRMASEMGDGEWSSIRGPEGIIVALAEELS
jgi:class 3 adenylate cyclase